MKSLSSYIYENLLDETSKMKAFTIIKPEFISHQDEIYDYIKNRGFELIVSSGPITITKSTAQELYKMHSKEDWYDDLCDYMASGDLIAASWTFNHEKYHDANSIDQMNKVKQHFRDKYAISEMKNCMHSSDSIKNVIRETHLIF